MIDWIGQRKGKAVYPMSEDDLDLIMQMEENCPIRNRSTGARKMRSYQELKLYRALVKIVAENAPSKNWDNENKVHFLARCQCGFVEAMVYDGEMVHMIPKSTSYANCHQPEFHAFVKEVIPFFADLLGVPVDELVKEGEDRS